MKVKFKILYNSGAVEEVVRDVGEEKLEEIANTINEAYHHELSAVLRLNIEEEAMFVDVQKTARISIQYL